MSASSVWGVTIWEWAGSRVLLAARMAAGLSPRKAGTKKPARRFELGQQAVFARASAHQLDEDGQGVLGLAHDDDVGHGPSGHGVGEGERATHHDQRPASRAGLAFRRQDRQAGQIEAVDQTGDLELVGKREGHHVEVGHRTVRLVGAQDLVLQASGGDVIGQEGALGYHPGQGVELAVDGLKPQRRHGHVIGARVAQGQRQIPLAVDRSPFGRQPRLA